MTKMFSKWLEEYRSLMINSRFLSQLGAFWIIVFSLLELWNTFDAVNKADQISEERWSSIYKIFVFHSVVGIVFTCRLFLVSFNKSNQSIITQATWLLGSSLVLYHLISNFLYYDGHILAMMHHSVFIVEFLFIVFSLTRFAATAWLSFNRSNEFNLNS